MERMPDFPNGPLAVGLLALHDRKFFEELLKDPVKTLDDLVRSGRLSLTKEDQDQVYRLIQAANDTDWKPLDEWDHYKKTGIWGGGWPMSWVAPTSHRP